MVRIGGGSVEHDLKFDGEIQGRIGPFSFNIGTTKQGSPPLLPSSRLDVLIQERDALLDRLRQVNADIKKLKGR